MPERIVNADHERNNNQRSPDQRTERFDKSMAIAAMVQAIPWFIWAAPVVLVFGFIIMAIWYNHTGHALKDFTSSVLGWFAMVPTLIGIVLVVYALRWCYRFYHTFIIEASARRTVRANEKKALAGARNAELKNDQLQAKIDLEKQLPFILKWAVEQGYPVEYGKDGLKISQGGGGVRITEMGQAQIGAGGQVQIAGPADELPTQVMYEDVRHKVPLGHVLVGIGKRGLIDTVQWAVGACIWICGLSGTGKTSTTVLRIEERHKAGHKFLGVDPHFFKPDSLTNAVQAYAGAFLRPMAQTAEETYEVLVAFLNEFIARKSGQRPKPWQPLTLIVDEVGSLMDVTDGIDKTIADLLKRIARICGQEARNFEMGGIFISQQATGLAWLRKVALMVIVHQLLMTSEKELACNGDKAVMKDMEHWPRGRTYVYGVGFGADGARTVQQPYFDGPGRSAPAGSPSAGDVDLVEEDEEVEEVDERVRAASAVTQKVEVEEVQEENGPAPVPALTGDMRKVFDAVQQLIAGGERVEARGVGAITGFGKDKANGLLNRLADLGYIERRKAV